VADATQRTQTLDKAFTDRVVVPFEGDGSGIGPLTWGQWEILDTMLKTNSSVPIGGVVPVPPGKTIADLAGELRFFLSRYPAMRTRVRFVPGGEPVQVLSDRGEAVFGIVDVGDRDEPAQAAERLAERWQNTPFDVEQEWPIRMAAVRHRGVPTHVVVIVSHFATDGVGVNIMVRELGERDPVTGRLPKGPATAPGPLELARRQRGPAGLRQSEVSLRYWDRLLRAAPLDRFAPPRDRGEPRYLEVDLDSPALYLASRALVPGSAGATAPVLLAAWAVATARVTGFSPSLLQMTVNNRFRAELAELSFPLCLNGLMLVDVAHVPFPEAVDEVRRALIQSMKYAYYHPLDQYRLRAAIGRERGREVDLGFLFNDQRSVHESQETETTPTPRAIRAALSRRSLRWRPLPLFIEKLMLFVRDVPGQVVRLSVQADTRHVPLEEVEAILLGMEAVVVDAACGGGAPAGSRRTAADTYV
jgi:hypothetical protein